MRIGHECSAQMTGTRRTDTDGLEQGVFVPLWAKDAEFLAFVERGVRAEPWHSAPTRCLNTPDPAADSNRAPNRCKRGTARCETNPTF